MSTPERRHIRTATRDILESLYSNQKITTTIRNKTNIDKDLPLKMIMCTRSKILKRFIDAILLLQNDKYNECMIFIKPVIKQIKLNLHQISKFKNKNPLVNHSVSKKYYSEILKIIYLQIKMLS